MPTRTLTLTATLFLTACGGSTGLFTGDTPPDCWAKCYTTNGYANVGGGLGAGQGQITGAMESTGLVWKCTDIDPTVLVAVTDKCPPFTDANNAP